nr:Protein Y43D4A.5, isoform b [Haemonchus contortus]
MRFPCCVTILEIVILLCNGAEQGVLDSDVAELDGNDNTKEVGNSLKANPTSDNTVITLDNFMDLLDTDKDIMDITKTDKSPTETDVEEVTQGRNDSLAASSRSPTEPEQVIPSMLRIMDDSRSNWTTTEATTTGFPPLEEINSTVTETTTHPMAFTIKDRFSEFDDLSSFKDISSGLDEMREQHKITEEPDPTITVPIPSDDDLQKTIIQNKSTVLNRSTSKNVKKNIVRTPTPSKELIRRKKVTSLTKSEKVDEAARGLAPLVPLARASAVGQFIYTTTIPPEFASIELHSTSGFNHRKTTHMNVPESHIQQLKSELEFLGVSDEGKPFAAMAPVRPPMHYGRARRKIVLTKEKREKSAPHPITRGYEIERKILNATVNEKSHEPNKTLLQQSDEAITVVSRGAKVSHEPKKTLLQLPDEAITVVSRGAKASHEPNNTPLQLSDEAITVVSRGMEAYGDKRNFNENNESVKGGLQSRPDREFVVAAEKVAKEPPSAPSSISPDINELEEALKELARLSKEVKDVAISDSVSFIGDYRDGISPVDGAVERKRRRRRRRGHGKGRQIDPDLGRTSRNTKSWSKKIPSPSPSDVDVERIARELEESSQRLIEQITKTGSDNGVHSSLVAHCTAIECNFEKGDLCGFVTSMPSRVRNHRNKRALVATAFFSVQRWANWLGKFNKSSLRVDRAPVFSPTNRHFAGTLLRAQQMATLTMQASTLEPFIISFDSWEATREMQMRVCCDDVCPLTTYSGSLKGERSWRRLALQCPKTTRTVTFECLNFGHRRGACGIDNFSLKSKSCYRRAL